MGDSVETLVSLELWERLKVLLAGGTVAACFWQVPFVKAKNFLGIAIRYKF